MSWEKAIFVGCSHGDLIDPSAESAVLAFIKNWKPKWRVHLGDFLDLRALRKKADPDERQEGIQWDYQEGFRFLDAYKPTHLTLGNHDHRIWRAASELSVHGVLAEAMRKLAEDTEDRFRKMRVEWRQWGVEQYMQLPMGGPKFLHGYRSTMYPAKALYENYGPSICAHVHKPDHHEARHIDGGKAYTVGTLADIKRMTYADAHPAKLGWRQSFLYSIHNTKTGAWHAWPVINEGGDWISPHGVL